jgi:light-regulated signal transduction histidine kinase (bacteriophytochrome)
MAYLITLPYTFLVFRKVEEELAQVVAKLRSSNAALENFAYIASHDLKEPLLSIASMLKLLQRRTRDKLDAESQAFITDSMSMTTRLQALVSDLLAYSRVGTQLKSFEPTDCNDALKRSLENLRTTIEQSEAVVTHDPLPEIIADLSQMVLVFQNLISNAIKFTGDGAPRVHISAQRKEKEWLFAVHDKGIGIPAGQTEQIFEIFQRLHKDKYPGSGIGLATCKKIVERHGGRIWATSVQGEGTTFCFTIPDKSA